jgi:hypothetical protein
MSQAEHIPLKTREQLAESVRKDITKSRRKDWRYFDIAQALLVLGIIASGLAAVTSALGLDKIIPTVLAVIASLSYSIRSQLSLEERSFFYYAYTTELEVALYDIEYSNREMDELLRQLKQAERKVRFPRLRRETRDEARGRGRE